MGLAPGIVLSLESLARGLLRNVLRFNEELPTYRAAVVGFIEKARDPLEAAFFEVGTLSQVGNETTHADAVRKDSVAAS